MRLSRLFQPRNPLFWLFVILNGLSSVLSYIVHVYELPWPAALVLAAFAIGNVVLGMKIALRLMRAPGETDTTTWGL